MSHYFSIDAIARDDRRLELKLHVDGSNPQDLPVDKCFALQLLLDAWKVETAPLGRDIASTLRWGEVAPVGHYDEFMAALEVVAVHYVDSVQILSTENLIEGARPTDFGGLEWSGDGNDQVAVYRIIARSAEWLSHIELGKTWYGVGWTGEEFERDLAAEVHAIDGRTVDLHVYRMRPDAASFPTSQAAALGILLDRAHVCECPLAEAISKEAWQEGAIDGRPADYVESVDVSQQFEAAVSLQHAAPGAAADFANMRWKSDDARLARYRVVVTDPRWLQHLAVGMRWMAWGSQELDDGRRLNG